MADNEMVIIETSDDRNLLEEYQNILKENDIEAVIQEGNLQNDLLVQECHEDEARVIIEAVDAYSDFYNLQLSSDDVDEAEGV